MLLHAALLTAEGQLFPVVIIHPGVVIPPVIFSPLIWSPFTRVGFGGCAEHVYSLADDAALHIFVIGFSARIAKREIRMQIARNTAVLDDIDGRTDDKRRDSVGFKVSRDQAHGLVADGSQRDQYGDVYFIFVAMVKYVGSIFINSVALTVFCRH